MGLFSFLSRRTGNRDGARTPVKAQPYDPILSVSLAHQGAYPEAGNDGNIGDAFSRGNAEFTESQLSLDTVSDDEHPAPAPGIPRFRDDNNARPSTAPGFRPPSVALPAPAPRTKRNGQKRPPPVSFRPARPGTAAPDSRPGSRGSMRSITSAFRHRSRHSRSSSLRSDGGKAFKDILDAQSEIKTSDFRTRVQATGARDYGEDVAVRNMGENGFDLGSTHVLSFYAQSKQAQPDVNRGAHAGGGPRLDRYKAGVRRISIHSSQLSLRKETSPANPMLSSPASPRKPDRSRRRSVNTYLPLSFGGLKPPQRQGADNLGEPPRTPAFDVDKMDSALSALKLAPPPMPHLPETAPAPTIRTARHLRDSVEVAKKRAELSVEDAVADGPPASDFAVWSATRSRRSSTIHSVASNPRKHQSLHTLRSSVSSSVSRETIIHATALSHPPTAAPSSQVQEVPESPAHDGPQSFDDHAALTTFGSAATPVLKTHLSIHKIREEDAVVSHGSFPLLPTTSAASSADMALPDDLEYPPPIRTRSMRGWSASSGTPTAAESTAASITTSSSHPFNRPHSLHTADTSVDLSIRTISPPLKPTGSRSNSITTQHLDAEEDTRTRANTPLPADTAVDAFSINEYLSDSDAATSPHDGDDHQLNQHLNPSLHNSHSHDTIHGETNTTATTNTIPERSKETLVDNFNIDDYLSSDAESLISPTNTTGAQRPNRRPTGEGEEELLFNDRGWNGAMQLPGLAESFQGSASSPSLPLPLPLPLQLPPRTSSACATARSGKGKAMGVRFSYVEEEEVEERKTGGTRRGERARMGRSSVAVAGDMAGRMSAVGEFAHDFGFGTDTGMNQHDARRRAHHFKIATDTPASRRKAAKKWERERQRAMQATAASSRKYILDTAAHYDYDDSYDEVSSSSADEGRRNGGLTLGNDCVVDDDDGYEADYVEDESDGLARRRQRRRQQRQQQLRTGNNNMRTRRLSALCRLEGQVQEQRPVPEEQCPQLKQQQLEEEQQEAEVESEQEDEKQSEPVGEKPEDKIAAAIRLRKQIKRARRLAGQPSAAVLRRQGAATQGSATRMSVPIVRIHEAE